MKTLSPFYTALNASVETVELMTVRTLTEAYNLIASTAKLKPIKKFETKPQGIKRFLEAQHVAKFALSLPLEEAKAANTAAAEAQRAANAALETQLANAAPLASTGEVALTKAGSPVKRGAIKHPVIPPVEEVTPLRRHVIKGQRKASISSRCRELILQGQTNDQIWAAVKVEFKEKDDRKKHYPAWNRAAMIRAGILEKKA